MRIEHRVCLIYEITNKKRENERMKDADAEMRERIETKNFFLSMLDFLWSLLLLFLWLPRDIIEILLDLGVVYTV